MLVLPEPKGEPPIIPPALLFVKLTVSASTEQLDIEKLPF